MKYRIAVLASGEGTTAESFIRSSTSGEIDVEVALVISSRQDAGILGRIANLNEAFDLQIQSVVINSTTHPAVADEEVAKGCLTIAEEQAILDTLSAGNFDLIMLMGYMKRLGSRLVNTFGWQSSYSSPFEAMMLNTHPGLLPETKGFYGIHVQEHVLSQNLPFAGQTLHVVADAYDEGPIIIDHKVAVEPNDTAEILFDRVKAVEKKYLPNDVVTFIEGRKQYLQTHKGV
jgi:phosphoribosylglycinamide formyltransferase-1